MTTRLNLGFIGLGAMGRPMAQAAREGRGAVQLDGRMIDIANIRMAQRLLAKADAVARAGR